MEEKGCTEIIKIDVQVKKRMKRNKMKGDEVVKNKLHIQIEAEP